MAPPKRSRADAEEDHTELEAWWAGVRKLGEDAYEAGKVLDLSVPVKKEEVRGPDKRISRLFVRRDFDALYRSIILTAMHQSWLVHLNGNSGIGKSAFLWYFIIRFAIDMGSKRFVLAYQSGDFIWMFDSNGQVQVIRKSEVQPILIRRTTWHLVNQKVESSDLLGRRVLLAASPDPANVKNALPDRELATVYMHPWDRDEFDALTKLWEDEATRLEVEASRLEVEASRLEVEAETKEELLAAYEVLEEGPSESICTQMKLAARKMRKDASSIRPRVAAAGTYYDWFGGVPRRLWQLPPEQLTEMRLEKFVDTALLKTGLGKVYRAISAGAQSDDISWMLLHFKRPQAAGCEYLLDFASHKIKYKFTSSLASAKREDLRVLLDSTDPELGALRGFIFEQEVVSKVLHSTISAVLMVDNKHCSICHSRTDAGQGPVNWISCDDCKKWYHYLCVRSATVPAPLRWRCEGCEGKPADQVATRRKLLLRYYRGDLKEALLKAGADAVNYVWRPLKKNNGGFDFVILPATLGQVTKAQYHTVPYEAIKDGLAALEAWNRTHNEASYPDKFLLSFFLSQDNYPEFGYQSYRNKHGRVSNNGIKGIMQAKVLIQTFDDEQPQVEQCADIPGPADTVEKLDDLAFEPIIDFQGMNMQQLKQVARERGLTGYSAELIEKLEAMVILDEGEDLEFEKRYYAAKGGALEN